MPDSYQNEIVTRCAPRWAWEVMDEYLATTTENGSLHKDISGAVDAMILACENND